jgi:L-threonylcarbamoyladenylate synthase
VAVLTLSSKTGLGEEIRMPGEPEEYARRLYATLREIDRQGYNRILVEEPPAEEKWLAVRDRLVRAGAEKSS